MIDTIVLTLTKDMFCITEPDKFTPSAQWVLSEHANRGIISKQNPIKKELVHGVYKPRLTLSRCLNALGLREIMLKIEVSLPKLMFGNNFNELQQKDFLAVVGKLATVVEEMGVVIMPQVLEMAPISTIHYSKNIVLTDGSTPHYYITKMRDTNVKLTLDVNETQYRNEGHSYKWHCNSYEVVFYDKIKEFETAQKSGKRVLEKDSALHIIFLDRLKKKKKLEILRMEVRLNKRTKLRQLFKKLAIKADLTFKSVFKLSIARKVLVHYFDELEGQRPALLDYKAPSDTALLATLAFYNPTFTGKKIIELYGLKKVFEIMTIRELRGLLQRNQRSWYRLMADAKEVRLPVISQQPFKVIREQLMKFKSLKLV